MMNILRTTFVAAANTLFNISARLRTTAFAAAVFLTAPLAAHTQGNWISDLSQPQTYTLHRATSKEATNGNADYRTLTPGQTMTILDEDGPGLISHMWFTISSNEPSHLKRIVLRMYWDGEQTPSVETPIGDFFGLGFGDYFMWNSMLLSVASDRAMNSFFPMPYAKHARVTLTNDGKESVSSMYYNIEYRKDQKPLPPHTLYFHAQYRQAQPNHGWTGLWYKNSDPLVNLRRNPTGEDNYVWFEARGQGHFVGVTMSVLQNQDGWWGEGNDAFYIDGATKPSLAGTGTEDYFLGAWDFRGGSFTFPLYGAPVVGKEEAGSRSSVYRFHFDSPIPFTQSMKATIEHGHANHRSDNYYSVAYWYQAEPHMAFPPLPEVEQRIPALQSVGGPGNGTPEMKLPQRQ